MAAVLTCATLAHAQAQAQAAADPPYVPLARSSLVAVDGALTAQTLLLRVHGAQDQQPVPGAELTVTIDGRSVAGAARPDGTWAAARPELPAAAPGRLQIVVAHAGVREVLDAQLPRASAPAAAAAPSPAAPVRGTGFLATLMHKQSSWWILNVLVVLIGVIAVSRRMS
ncbi:MAG TPA: hypothetical protein VEY89_11055 [Candidatus Dormibacteraeota bacterium]|nr:hypothetical protein [Candidatus Dormibacteraeota bacterium]